MSGEGRNYNRMNMSVCLPVPSGRQTGQAGAESAQKGPLLPFGAGAGFFAELSHRVLKKYRRVDKMDKFISG